VRVLYANRDADSVIFARSFDELAQEYGERLGVASRFDVEHGFVDAAAVTSFVATANDADYFICGPAPFMDIVETALLDGGVPPERVHIERFGPAPTPPAAADVADDSVAQVTIELKGRAQTTTHHPGTTILQTARQMGLAPPSSCEAGSCATCMARLIEGTVAMHVNDALTDDEVAEGWILTCQSVPTSATVSVVYEL
jgi:ferredoxin